MVSGISVADWRMSVKGVERKDWNGMDSNENKLFSAKICKIFEDYASGSCSMHCILDHHRYFIIFMKFTVTRIVYFMISEVAYFATL